MTGVEVVPDAKHKDFRREAAPLGDEQWIMGFKNQRCNETGQTLNTRFERKHWCRWNNRDVQGPAWPESPGLSPALEEGSAWLSSGSGPGLSHVSGIFNQGSNTVQIGLETMQDQPFISPNFGPGLRAWLGPEKFKAQALGPLKPCVGPGLARACEGPAWRASGPQARPRTSLFASYLRSIHEEGNEMSADSAPPFARILNAGKGNEDGEEERRGSGHCTHGYGAAGRERDGGGEVGIGIGTISCSFEAVPRDREALWGGQRRILGEERKAEQHRPTCTYSQLATSHSVVSPSHVSSSSVILAKAPPASRSPCTRIPTHCAAAVEAVASAHDGRSNEEILCGCASSSSRRKQAGGLVKELSPPPAGSLATTATATGGVLRSPKSLRGRGASVHGILDVFVFEPGRCPQPLWHNSLLEAPQAPRLPLSVLLAAAVTAGRLSMSDHGSGGYVEFEADDVVGGNSED
ncbi:hypothetical protein B0H14DRAFT_2602425 [Mycena olivaceomarginata]|nr:hypothetical protein B0H14DRAFT_2602425 [Mycena olivaceomarginata]